MQGIKPVLQTHHLSKPGTKYQVSGVLGPFRVSLHNLSKSLSMISPLNPSLLTGSVVKSLGYCSLGSSGARFMWEAWIQAEMHTSFSCFQI